MSSIECKRMALDALAGRRGDDLERARTAFRGLSSEEMKRPHGYSGKTRAEVLAGYEADRARVEAAIAWVQSIPV